MCSKCQPDQRSGRCPKCLQCLVHRGCRCRACPQCGERMPPKSRCGACGACKTHHHSIGVPAGRSFPHRKCSYTSTQAPCTYVLNPLRETIGVELEIADLGKLREAPMTRWVPQLTCRWEHDGSVSPSGLELVTGPASGDTLYKGLEALGAALGPHCKVNDTCGFHVHVDGAALSLFELRRLLVGWSIIEEQFFGPFVPPPRWKNVYCRPLRLEDTTSWALMNLKTSGEVHHWIYQYLYEINCASYMRKHETRELRLAHIAELKRLVDACKAKKYMNAARRKTLNIHSWEMRGTVEFRLQAGTVDPGMILHWPLLCGHVVSKITSLTDREILAWIKKPPALSVLLDGWKLPKGLATWTNAKLESWASKGR